MAADSVEENRSDPVASILTHPALPKKYFDLLQRDASSTAGVDMIDPMLVVVDEPLHSREMRLMAAGVVVLALERRQDGVVQFLALVDDALDTNFQHRHSLLLTALFSQTRNRLLAQVCPSTGRSLLAVVCCRVRFLCPILPDRQLAFQMLHRYCACLNSCSVPILLDADADLLDTFVMPSLKLIAASWQIQVDRIAEQLRNCLLELLILARTLQCHKQIVQHLLDFAVSLSWSMRGKLNTLVSLGRDIGADQLMSRVPSILRGMQTALSGNHLAHVATELFKILLPVIAESELIEWMTALTSSGDALVLQTSLSHLIPVLVRCRHSAACSLLRSLCWQSVSATDGDQMMCVSLHLLRTLRQDHRSGDMAASEDFDTLLRSATCSWNPQCRRAALMACCATPRPSVVPAAVSMQIAVELLVSALVTDCPATRHTVISELRRLAPRIGAIAASSDVLSPLVEAVVSGLAHDSNYQRRINCLLVLQYLPLDLFGSLMIQPLLLCLHDPAEDVRDKALYFLQRQNQGGLSPDELTLLQSQCERLADTCDPRRTASSAAICRLLLLHTDDVGRLIERHLQTARQQLDIFSECLKTAALAAPVHGRLSCLRSCLCHPSSPVSDELFPLLFSALDLIHEVVDRVLNALSCHDANVHHQEDQDVSPSFADIGIALDSAAAVGEPDDADDPNTNVQDSVHPSQIRRQLMACCWLNMKECCLFIGRFADMYVTDDCQDEFIACVPRLVATVRRVLINCRHKGAIEGAKVAWSRVCSAALSYRKDGRQTIAFTSVLQVLDQFLDAVSCSSGGDARCSVTRRGAGRPMLLKGILTSCSQPVLDSTVQRLLSIASIPLPADADQHSDLPQTDSLYMLHALVASNVLAPCLAGWLERITAQALCGLTSPLWNLRNACLVLFGELVPRMIGQKKSRSQADMNVATMLEFFGRFAAIDVPLLSCLTVEQPTAAVAALSLLTHLRPPGNSEVVRVRVRRLLGARQWTVRRLAAEAMYAILDERQLCEEIHKVSSQLGSKVSHNLVHGLLMLAVQAVQYESVQPLLSKLCAYGLSDFFSGCAVITATALKLRSSLPAQTVPMMGNLDPSDCLTRGYHAPGEYELTRICTKLALDTGRHAAVISAASTTGVNPVLEEALLYLCQLPDSPSTDWAEFCERLCTQSLFELPVEVADKCLSLCSRVKPVARRMASTIAPAVANCPHLLEPVARLAAAADCTPLLRSSCHLVATSSGACAADQSRLAAARSLQLLWMLVCSSEVHASSECPAMLLKAGVLLLTDDEPEVRCAARESYCAVGRPWSSQPAHDLLVDTVTLLRNHERWRCPQFSDERLDRLDTVLVELMTPSPAPAVLLASACGDFCQPSVMKDQEDDSLFPTASVPPEASPSASSLPAVFREQLRLARVCASCLLCSPRSDWKQAAVSTLLPMLTAIDRMEQLDDAALYDVIVWPGMYSSLGCVRVLISVVLGDRVSSPTGVDERHQSAVSCNIDLKESAMVDDRQCLRKIYQYAAKLDEVLARCPGLPSWLYSSTGQLSCVVCQTPVRSELLWTAHLASRQHKETIASLKSQRDGLKRSSQDSDPPASGKRRKDASGVHKSMPPPLAVPPKKGILKNAPALLVSARKPKVTAGPLAQPSEQKMDTGSGVPTDFFDSDAAARLAPGPSGSSSAQASSSSASTSSTSSDQQPSSSSTASSHRLSDHLEEDDSELPEGFFDDPVMDAKARHVEYRDPADEEWDKFQREMQTEMVESEAILDEDQQGATIDRQLEDVDEQIRNLSRVVSVERKKAELCQSVAGCSIEDEDDALDEAEFDEFLDWRSKGAWK